MGDSVTIQEKPVQDKLGEMLRTNRLAILLEIVVVLLPMYLGLIINDRSGGDHIPLGNGIVVLGSPAMYLGLIISLLLLWGASRLRGAGWADEARLGAGRDRPGAHFRIGARVPGAGGGVQNGCDWIGVWLCFPGCWSQSMALDHCAWFD